MTKRKKAAAPLELTAPAVPAKIGRPTVRTVEMVDDLLLWISNGQTLLDWCRVDDNRPHASTIYDWLDTDQDLSRRFARARVRGFDAIAMDCMRIADEPDWVFEESVTKDGKGAVISTTVTKKDNAQNKKNRIWARLQLLSKWDPKRYGEKLGIGQAEGLEPVVMTHEERVTRIRAILASGKKAEP